MAALYKKAKFFLNNIINETNKVYMRSYTLFHTLKLYI